jgi:hypothetical protein
MTTKKSINLSKMQEEILIQNRKMKERIQISLPYIKGMRNKLVGNLRKGKRRVMFFHPNIIERMIDSRMI